MEALCKIRDIYRFINEFENGLYTNCGIGINEGLLLCALKKCGDCTSGRIAELLNLSVSNSSKVIASMERKGLIQRSIGKTDKRRMYFSLTEKGVECLRLVECISDNILRAVETIKDM